MYNNFVADGLPEGSQEPSCWSHIQCYCNRLHIEHPKSIFSCAHAVSAIKCLLIEQNLQNNTIIVALVLLSNAKTVGAFLKTVYLG